MIFSVKKEKIKKSKELSLSPDTTLDQSIALIYDLHNNFNRTGKNWPLSAMSQDVCIQ